MSRFTTLALSFSAAALTLGLATPAGAALACPASPNAGDGQQVCLQLEVGATTNTNPLIIKAPHVLVDYWGWSGPKGNAYSDPSNERNLIVEWLDNAAGSAWLGATTQYFGTNGFVNPDLLQWHEYRNDASPPTSNPTFPAMGVEAKSALAASGLGWDPQSTIVVLAMPSYLPDYPVSGGCALHASQRYSGDLTGNPGPYYILLPYQPTTYALANSFACGGCDSVADADFQSCLLDQSLQHELAEAMTDPCGGNSSFDCYGWNDGTNQPGEIGDKCAGNGRRVGQIDDVSGLTAWAQPLWSDEALNNQGACVWEFRTHTDGFSSDTANGSRNLWYLRNDGTGPTGYFPVNLGQPSGSPVTSMVGTSHTPGLVGPTAQNTFNGSSAFYIDANHNLIQVQVVAGAFARETNWGGPPAGFFWWVATPTALNIRPGRLDMFMIAADNNTWVGHLFKRTVTDKAFDSGWVDLGPGPGTGVISSAAVTSPQYGQISVFVLEHMATGPSQIYEVACDFFGNNGLPSCDYNSPTWTQWGVPPGASMLYGDPAAASWLAAQGPNGSTNLRHTDVFMIDALSTLWHGWHYDTQPSGWESIAGPVYPAPGEPGHAAGSPDLMYNVSAASMGDDRIFLGVLGQTGQSYTMLWSLPSVPAPYFWTPNMHFAEPAMMPINYSSY